MAKLLTPDWFGRDTTQVARELLGKKLCREFLNGEIVKLQINEVEAYLGVIDEAAHSYGGRRTAWTATMYGPSGTIYMYLIYGMYWMLNIVTEKEEVPTAVLIRGAINLDVGRPNKLDGPGKLTRALELDKSFNNQILSKNTGLWIEDAASIPDEYIVATPRIGINYATEPWLSAPLRFLIKQ